MTVQNSIFESFYPTDWSVPTQSSQSYLILSLQHPARQNAGLMDKLFLPSAGALYVHRPSKRRRVLNRAVDKLESSSLPGYEYVIAHLYDKYRRNLTISTLGQTAQTLSGFLTFLQGLGRSGIEEISRKAIADYIDHEQERGLKINSVRNHLQTVYAFIQYLIDKDILPLELLRKKIRVKLPEVLQRAIPA
ncbi:MAG: phage integrase SAM-like domain-containing protein, partial [Proteobacteria bacterium]|nr:phage integrase SAM-like domain-containing protein [Pseudomonadota bacterium]